MSDHIRFLVPACLALLFFVTAAIAQNPAVGSVGCYAFLRRNGLWVACDGKSQPVTHKHYWVEYAVAPTGTHLAIKGGPWALRNRQEDFRHGALVVHLAGGGVERRPAPGYFLPTCGTIVLLGSEVSDLITGRPLSASGYGSDFRCSDTRSVTIGIKTVKEKISPGFYLPTQTLRLGEPPGKVLCASVDALYIAVSPGGSYVAWQGSDSLKSGVPKICVQKPGADLPTCVQDFGDDLFTVSDAGEVLWDGSYGDGNPNKSAAYYWRPGLAEPILLQKDSSQPQWITASAAKALIEGYKSKRWPML